METKKYPFLKWGFPVITFILFAIIYAVYFYLRKEALVFESGLDDSKFIDPAMKYGMYGGIVLAVVGILLTYIVNVLFGWILKGKVGSIILQEIIFAVFLGLGVWLLYFEPQFTKLGVAIILFVGKPLFIASLAMIALHPILTYFIKR